MYTAAVILHLIVCFLMIASILLQAGKGAEIGAAFGGTSQTIFGSRGAGTFLSKVTIGTAVIFMLTSLGLALLSKQRDIASSVISIPATSDETTPSGTDSPDTAIPDGESTSSDVGNPDDATPTVSESPSDDTTP